MNILSWQLLAALVLVFMGMYLVYKFVKTAMKTVLTAIIVALVSFLFLGFFFFMDASSLNNQFDTASKLVYISTDDEIHLGFALQSENVTSIKTLQRDRAAYWLRNDNLKEIKGDYDWVIIIDTKVIPELSDEIRVLGKNFRNDQIVAILQSSNPYEIAGPVLESNEFLLAIQFSDINEFKSLFGAAVVNEVLENQLFFFNRVKDGNIQIYPKTIVFRFVTLIPKEFLKNMVGESKAAAEDAIRATLQDIASNNTLT